MNKLVNVGALVWTIWMTTQSVGAQEFTFPEIIDTTWEQVSLTLTNLPIWEIWFSSVREPIPNLNPNGRETIHRFSAWNMQLRFIYTHWKNGWNFAWSFDIDNDSIPPQVVIPEGTQIPNFHAVWDIAGAFYYNYNRFEVWAQLRDGDSCDYWAGIWVTKYKFGLIAALSASWEVDGVPYSAQWTVRATGDDTLYNPFLSADMNCKWRAWNRWNILFDGSIHGEFWNTNARINLWYQHQFTSQFAAGFWISVSYNDYHDDLSVLSKFRDGWTDLEPNINFKFISSRSRSKIYGILGEGYVWLNLELELKSQ